MQTILYDVTHTSHSVANSGIQRVVRRLAAHWPDGGTARLRPVIFDKYARAWRHIDREEARLLAFSPDRRPGERRGASWSFRQYARGRLAKYARPLIRRAAPGADAFVCVELFAGDARIGLFPRFKAGMRIGGPLVAVFHDMIALQMPGVTPRRTVENTHAYLEALLAFDIVVAVSEASRDALTQYWKEKKVSHTPRVIAVPLGVDPAGGGEYASGARAQGECAHDGRAWDDGALPLVLSVGTLEGRKNHLALLDACERLWSSGRRFRLRLIGMLNKETGAAAAERVGALRAAGRPIEWIANADDRTLGASYRECVFTVYPSLGEGFGLPVLESLAHGRPCVCSGQNAMAEIVRDGGGCVPAGEPTAENLARHIDALLADRAKIAALSQEARSRKIRTWDDYARDMRALVSGFGTGG